MQKNLEEKIKKKFAQKNNTKYFEKKFALDLNQVQGRNYYGPNFFSMGRLCPGPGPGPGQSSFSKKSFFVCMQKNLGEK